MRFDEVGIDILGDGKMLMSKVDISEHAFRGRDLYLYRCNDCGTQNLLDWRGGDLPCECETPSSGVTVTCLNQLTDEARKAEQRAYHDTLRNGMGVPVGKVA